MLGGELCHKFSSRHNDRRFFPIPLTRWYSYKKYFPYFNVSPRGIFFLTWSLDHSVSSLPMAESCHSILIGRRLHHSHASRQHIRQSLTNRLCLYHYCAISWSLHSYSHNLCHWLLRKEINLFIIGSAKNV